MHSDGTGKSEAIMPKGVLNVEWELCAQVAREMNNDSAVNIKRLMRELKIIKPDLPGIKRTGFNGEFEGYTPEEVTDCRRWLVAREDNPIKEARMTTCLLGSPCYLQQYDRWILDNIPAVYDASSHDTFVREHAKILRALGFIYRGGRLPKEELE